MKLFLLAAVALVAVTGVSAGGDYPFDGQTCGGLSNKEFWVSNDDQLCSSSGETCSHFTPWGYKEEGVCCSSSDSQSNEVCLAAAEDAEECKLHLNCYNCVSKKRHIRPRRPSRCAPHPIPLDDAAKLFTDDDDCDGGRNCTDVLQEFLEDAADLDAGTNATASLGPDLMACTGRNESLIPLKINGYNYQCVKLCCRCCYNAEWEVFTEGREEVTQGGQCINNPDGLLPNAQISSIEVTVERLEPQRFISDSTAYLCCGKNGVVIATPGYGTLFRFNNDATKGYKFFGREYRNFTAALSVRCVSKQGGSNCENGGCGGDYGREWYGKYDREMEGGAD